jgi:hypothetical protein
MKHQTPAREAGWCEEKKSLTFESDSMCTNISSQYSLGGSKRGMAQPRAAWPPNRSVSCEAIVVPTATHPHPIVVRVEKIMLKTEV